MQVKRFYVEAKRSANFNTYTVGFDVEVETEDGALKEETVRKFQETARKLANEQILQDKQK